MQFNKTKQKHHLYDPSTYNNDIAILKLEHPIAFVPNHIEPAQMLGKQDLNADTYVYAIGWGSQEYGGESSNVLLNVRLQVRMPQECFDVDPGNFDSATELCVGGNYYQDTCKGDSGGGLYARDKRNLNNYYLVGITSNGYVRIPLQLALKRI